MTTIPRPSLEFVHVQMTADVDLESGSAFMGFALPGAPAPAAWNSAGWVVGAVNKIAYLLDSTSLAVGHWNVWVRVTDSPEDIIRLAGTVRVI